MNTSNAQGLDSCYAIGKHYTWHLYIYIHFRFFSPNIIYSLRGSVRPVWIQDAAQWVLGILESTSQLVSRTPEVCNMACKWNAQVLQALYWVSSLILCSMCQNKSRTHAFRCPHRKIKKYLCHSERLLETPEIGFSQQVWTQVEKFHPFACMYTVCDSSIKFHTKLMKC
jgi:hypothetical protein